MTTKIIRLICICLCLFLLNSINSIAQTEINTDTTNIVGIQGGYDMICGHYTFVSDTVYSQFIYTDCDTCQLKVMVGYSVVKLGTTSFLSQQSRLIFSDTYLDINKKPLRKDIIVIISRELHDR